MDKFRIAALLLFALMLPLSSSAARRDPLDGLLRPPDECGDPAMTSQAYEAFNATVLKVLDGDTLLLRCGEHSSCDKVQVQLACLEAPPLSSPVGWIAREKLSDRIQGEQVFVAVSPYQEVGEDLNVMIQLPGGHPINEGVAQLEQGLARYREFGPYDLDSWLSCHYKRAEQKARQGKRGLWGEL